MPYSAVKSSKVKFDIFCKDSIGELVTEMEEWLHKAKKIEVLDISYLIHGGKFYAIAMFRESS